MTKQYRSSYQFQLSDDNGDMKGGGYWLSHDINRYDNTTWKGIIIDAYGDLLGRPTDHPENHQGITVWTDKGGATPSHKDLQIIYSQYGSKIVIYGGESAWLSYDFDATDQRTWDGIIIQGSTLTCWEAAKELNGKATVKVKLDNKGLNIYGASIYWTPTGWDDTDPHGIVIDDTGIRTYDGRVGEDDKPMPTFELKPTGYLTIGYTDDEHIICDVANGGIWTFGISIICTPAGYDKNDPLTHNGVILNSDGLFGYEAGKEKVRITNEGDLFIIGGSSKWLPQGALIDDPTTWQGVVIYSEGIFGYYNSDDAYLTFQLRKNGDFALGEYSNSSQTYTSGKPHLRYLHSSGILWMQGGIVVCASGNFTAGDTSTYNGVVIDYNGMWMCHDGDVHLQIKNDGTFILGQSESNRLAYIPDWGTVILQGACIVCAAEDFDINNSLTYNGVILDSTGLYAFVSAEPTFSLTNNGELLIGKSNGPQIYCNNSGIAMIGASIVCVGDDFVYGNPSTYDGVIIDHNGFYAYNDAVATVQILNSGNFEFGTGTHKIAFNALTGVLTYAGITSGNTTEATPPTTGVTFDSHGIRSYLNNNIIFNLSNTGSFTLGRTINKQITYSDDNIIIGSSVNVIDTSGSTRQIGDITKRAYSAINSDGKIIGEILGTTLIAGVLASTIAGNSGSSVTMDTIADGTNYKKFSTSQYNDTITATYRVIYNINGSGDASFRNLQSSALSGSGNRAVYVDYTGTFTTSSSDRRLKNNIQETKYGLSEILKLNPVEFYWINTEKFGKQKEIGLIAQEVQQIIPEIIGINSDETLSIDYPKLIPVIINAIQELYQKLNSGV